MKRLLLLFVLFISGNNIYSAASSADIKRGVDAATQTLVPFIDPNLAVASAVSGRAAAEVLINQPLSNQLKTALVNQGVVYVYIAGATVVGISALYALKYCNIEIPMLNAFLKVETASERELRQKRDQLILQQGGTNLEQMRNNLVNNMEIDVAKCYGAMCSARDKHGTDSEIYKVHEENHRLALEGLLTTRKIHAQERERAAIALQTKSPATDVSKEEAGKILAQAQ